MVRTLTANNTSKVAQNLGIEPIVVMKVEWAGGTVYYADKTITIGTISALGSILECADISSREKAESMSEISNVSVKLDDCDGSLRTIIKTEQIEGVDVTVYHHYVGNVEADLLTVLKGRIISPVTWNEGDRSLTFEVESWIDDQEVGYAPEVGDLTNLSKEAEEQVWPLSFGTNLRVPAVRVRRKAQGSLKYSINHNFDEFEVEGGEEFFPQGSEVYIKINNIRFSGTFDGDVFTASGKNLAHHTNLAFAGRPSIEQDDDYANPQVAWLAADNNIKGLYCIVEHATHGWMINRCTHQVGKKCWFIKPWRPVYTNYGIQMDSNSTITETAGRPRTSWLTTFAIETYSWYYNNMDPLYDEHTMEQISYQGQNVLSLRNGEYVISSHFQVLLEKDFNDLYVFNLIPTNEVLEVYAYRTDNSGPVSRKIFAPVPSSYYTKHLSYSLAGKTCSALEFAVALEDKIGEDWEGDVYVSSRSSVGPNSADIIKWLIDTYSNLTCDATTFAAVHINVAKFWANFTVFDQPNVMKLCEEIAWQSRCALIIQSGVVKIKYLSEVPDADLTVTELEAELKSLELSYTDTESLVTKLIAKWQREYSPEERTHYPRERQIIYKDNVDLYGLHEQETKFYIYNVMEFVKISAYFWGYRYSNSWRKARLRSFLKGLKLEPFDCVAHDIDAFSTNSIRGELRDVQHNTAGASIQTECVLGSKAGDEYEGEPIEDLYFWLGDPSYPVTTVINPKDPGEGLHEVDYIIPSDKSFDYEDTEKDKNDENDGEDSKYHLVFTEYPTVVQRGVNFPLTVRVQDYDGNDVSVNLNTTLQLTSADGSDVLNTTNISIVDGIWSSATVQVTGGSGQDTANLIAAGNADYASGTTPSFTIVEAFTDTLSWDTAPSSVTRGTDFSVAISGGGAGDILQVQLASSDSTDKLYVNGVLTTQITLDGSGEYTNATWSIRGGSGVDVGVMTLHDNDNIYADKSTSQFTIGGVATLSVTHTLAVTQECAQRSNYLEISIPGVLKDQSNFTMFVTMKKWDGTTDTSFNGTARISAVDADGTDLTFLDLGTLANCYGKHGILEFSAGVWVYDYCQMELTDNVSPATFSVYDVDNTVCTGTLEKIIGQPVFEVAIPANMYRGTAFDVEIQAKDADGNFWISYVPVTHVDISLVSEDGDDVISPLTTDNTGWVNGAKTVSCTITGGIGTDNITVTCADHDDVLMVGEDTGSVKTAFGEWYSGGTLASNVRQVIYHTAREEFYAVCENNKLYRYDGGTTWTEILTLTGSVSAAMWPCMAYFNGDIYVAVLVSDTAKIYRFDPATPTMVLEATNYVGFNIRTPLFVRGSYLYATAMTKDASQYMMRRTTAGVWQYLSNVGTCEYATSLEELDSVGYVLSNPSGGLYYFNEASMWARVQVNAANGTCDFRQPGIYDSKLCYQSDGATKKLAYITGKTAAETLVDNPTNYHVMKVMHGANSKLFVLTQHDTTSKYAIHSYNGSWALEYDFDSTDLNFAWMSSNVDSIMVIRDTTVVIKG